MEANNLINLAEKLKKNPKEQDEILDDYILNHSKEASVQNLELVMAQIENTRKVLAGITGIGKSVLQDIELSTLKIRASRHLEGALEELWNLREAQTQYSG